MLAAFREDVCPGLYYSIRAAAVAAVVGEAREAIRPVEVVLTYGCVTRNYGPGEARHVVHVVACHVDEEMPRVFVFDLRDKGPFFSSNGEPPSSSVWGKPTAFHPICICSHRIPTSPKLEYDGNNHKVARLHHLKHQEKLNP